MMARVRGHSPALYHYLKKYQEDPQSRVFAPLAEAYRKAGLVDEAIDIAREGVVKHPSFIGGKVALSRALFEKARYVEVLDELNPVIQNAPDNLAAQKLVGDSHLMLGHLTEALGSFKVLLYYNPTDEDVSKMVTELEGKLIEQKDMIVQGDFNIKPLQSIIEDDPEIREKEWKNRIEFLQGLLQRVERYRSKTF